MTSPSSPYGPHVRTGRGGAGNFHWQSSSPSADSQDVEAQAPQTLDEQRKQAAAVEHSATGTAVQNAQARESASKYIRVGRGGAGNMSLVQDTGGQPEKKSTLAISAQLSPSTNSPIRYTGRGGAGNYAAASAAKQDVEMTQRDKEQRTAEHERAKAEIQVEDLIKPPSQAWFGGKRQVSKEEDPES